MENLTHALYMAFGFMVFIVATTYTLFLINKLNTTAETLTYRLDETNYYDSYVLDDLIKDNDDVTNKAYKVVGIDSIIPTLYRYSKESFSVKILDENGNLLQIFDTTIESSVNTAATKLASQRTDKEKALLILYGSSEKSNMFGAPWIGSLTDESKERIDMYISGLSGYINNTYVDYSTNNLNQYSGRKFKEIFSEYLYEGDTISTQDEEGEVIETLTGTKQGSTKIVITYQLVN